MVDILFVDVWGGEPMYPSLSLGYLSSIAKQEKFTTKIISPNIIPNFSEEKFYEIIKKEKPKYCAFTTFTTQVFNAYRLIRIAKKEGCIILIGGAHVSSLGANEIEKECPEADYLFLGESDNTFRKFLKGKIKNKIIRSGKFIKDLNLLPFPDRSAYLENGWAFDSNYLFKPLHILISSRGCPYNCRFCFKDTFGFKYRQRSIDNVLDECEEIKNMGGKELFFIDDLFALNKKWIIDFCKEKIRRGINLPFKCLERIDGLDLESLSWLKKAGCHTVSVGIESGDQDVINWVRKNITLSQAKEAIKMIHHAGINVEAFFIIGHLIDNRKSVNKTIQFASELNADFPRFFLFSPYPGSQVWKEMPEEYKEKYWLKRVESDLRSSNPISICEIPSKELVVLWHKAHDRAYSNINYLSNVIRNFQLNPRGRTWIKEFANFIGGGVLKLHRFIRK